MVILSQVDIEPWHIYSGMICAVSYTAVRTWTAISKEKRESKRDEAHTTFLQRIATSNEDAVTKIATLNQKLENEREIRDIMHKQNSESFAHVCKFRA